MAEQVENLNFEELKKSAEPMTSKGNGLILDDDDDVVVDNASDESNPEPEYHGPGIIVEKPKEVGVPGVPVGPMADKERAENTSKKFGEMDDMIAQAKAANEAGPEAVRKFRDQIGWKPYESDSIPEADRKKLVDEVTVLIDKLGAGTIEFTPEERARMQKSKKIRLVEVENKELQGVKIARKFNREDDKTFLQKTFNRALASTIALGSYYTAKMKNVSAEESMKIMQRPGEDSARTALEKWSVLYSKLTDVSCGEFKNFDDFISHTAYLDYNNFIYAILCSSYPETDSISFTCNQEGCGKRFRVEYSNKDIIRRERISPEQKNLMQEILDNTINPEDARKYMEENSALSYKHRFALDDKSGFLVDIYIPSAKDQIEKILPYMNREMEGTTAMLAHNICTILMPAGEEEDEGYIEVDSYPDIVEVLGQMNEYQWAVITAKINEMLSMYTIEYGLDHIVCPHCHHDYGEMPLNLDQLLFQRVQRRMRTEIV
jgi:hypothetical protein